MWLTHDLHGSWRFLRQAPGFTAIAVLVLALGIGVNTAVFSLAEAALLAPLPYAHPQQLVQLFTRESTPGNFPISGPDFRDWQTQAKSFAEVSLFRFPYDQTLTGHGAPQLVRGVEVENNFFRLLGVHAALGDASQQKKNTQVFLSYAFWQSEFGGDAGVIGRSLVLSGAPYVIAGVLPSSFRWHPEFQVWLTFDMSPEVLGPRGFYSFSAIGRLRPGVPPKQAQTELNAIATRLARQYPVTNRGVGVNVVPLRDSIVGTSEQASLLTLLAVTGLVLLIACANVANMLLARGLNRRKEMAIRLALGAGRCQIIRQLLGESGGLAILGGAAGALGAWIAVRASSATVAARLVTPRRVELNATVLAMTLLVAVVCAIGCGLAPAYQLMRTRMHQELCQTGSAGSSRRGWLARSLAVSEITLALVLVVLAGLFLESFARERSRPMGLQPDHLLTLELSFASLPFERLQAFQGEFLQQLQALPGIENASFASELPLEGGLNNGYPVIAGQSLPAHVLVEGDRVSASYFETMRIPLLAGALYNQQQQQTWAQATPLWAPLSSPSRAVLQRLNLSIVANEAFAEAFFPGQDAIGKRFRLDKYSPWVSIQGVVGNVPILGPRDTVPMPEVFYPVLAAPYLLLRSRLSSAELTGDVRRLLARMEAPLPVYNVREMREVIGESAGAAAFQSGLIAAFAALALLLAAAGIYGITAYLMAGRTQEIGVRMALGASRTAVLRIVLGQCLGMAVTGVALGAAASLIAARLVRTQLFQVPAGDPRLLMAAAAIVVAVSFLAGYLPAYRAASADPLRVLRAP